jgi:hypothetical protein
MPRHDFRKLNFDVPISIAEVHFFAVGSKHDSISIKSMSLLKQFLCCFFRCLFSATTSSRSYLFPFLPGRMLKNHF